MSTRLAVIGTVGVPASYGGFETVVENLLVYANEHGSNCEVTVYCSGSHYSRRRDFYLGARLRYLPLQANGKASIFYDILSLIFSVRQDVVLVFGVSGALFIPIFRCISSAKVVINVDGVESRREKWGRLARWFLKVSEAVAVRFSHEVIADNQGICDYIEKMYRRTPTLIAYGGDHATGVVGGATGFELPTRYCLGICRIEPENNIAAILAAFSKREDLPLIMVGNWSDSAYGRELKFSYKGDSGLILLDPIYDMGVLSTLRSQAACYVHGHSAGGTNPSLVEALHFGMPLIVFDCQFNRYTLRDLGAYFSNTSELQAWLDQFSVERSPQNGLLELARERYTWSEIGKRYFDLIDRCSSQSKRVMGSM